jgi:hypothetical protein
MNNCPFDKEKLTGYYDGEFQAAGKAEVEEHISSCSECLRDLGEIKSAALLVKDLPRFRAPRPISENVAREIAIAGRVHVLDRFRRRLLWATAAAAGLLVIANVIYFRDQGRSAPEMASGPGAVPILGRVESLKKDGRINEHPASEAAAEVDRELMDAPALRELAESKALEGEKQQSFSKPVPPAAPPALKQEAAAKEDQEQLHGKAPALRERDAGEKRRGKLIPSVAAPAPAPPRKPAGPVAYTLTALQMAKARPRVEAILRNAKLVPAVPALESTLILELTDAELVELKKELDKQGDMRLIPGRIEDSRLAAGAQMERDDLQDSRLMEAEQFDRAAAVAKEKNAEPRRRIILHFLEVKSLPVEPSK